MGGRGWGLLDRGFVLGVEVVLGRVEGDKMGDGVLRGGGWGRESVCGQGMVLGGLDGLDGVFVIVFAGCWTFFITIGIWNFRFRALQPFTGHFSIRSAVKSPYI